MLNLKTLLKELRNSGKWIESPASLKEESQVIIAENLIKSKCVRPTQMLLDGWAQEAEHVFKSLC